MNITELDEFQGLTEQMVREWLHVEIPEEVWLSAGVVVTWLGGYLKRDKTSS